MSNSLENYWRNIYQKRTKNNYETQTIQSKEIIDWHINYIEKLVPDKFKEYKPRVLDIGCNSGLLTNLFCRFSSEVVGIDYEKGFIIDAKSKYSNPVFHIGDIYNLEKIKGTFDLVVCFGVLQNINDLEKALKNVKYKLNKKVNSKAIFTTINHNSIFNANRIAFKFTHPKEEQKFNLKVFKKQEFEKFSEKSGLKLTKYEYLFVLPRFLNFIQPLARKFLPSTFSHHVLIEMENV